MPRFFFYCEGAENFRDDEGVELADLPAARLQAIRNAAEVLSDKARQFSAHAWWRAYVADEAGEVVFTMTLTMEGGPPQGGLDPK